MSQNTIKLHLYHHSESVYNVYNNYIKESFEDYRRLYNDKSVNKFDKKLIVSSGVKTFLGLVLDFYIQEVMKEEGTLVETNITEIMDVCYDNKFNYSKKIFDNLKSHINQIVKNEESTAMIQNKFSQFIHYLTKFYFYTLLNTNKSMLYLDFLSHIDTVRTEQSFNNNTRIYMKNFFLKVSQDGIKKIRNDSKVKK